MQHIDTQLAGMQIGRQRIRLPFGAGKDQHLLPLRFHDQLIEGIALTCIGNKIGALFHRISGNIPVLDLDGDTVRQKLT